MTTQGLEAATEKMRSAGVPGVAIDVFSRFHEQVRSQVTGLIPEDSISPLEQVTRLDDVVAGSAGAIDDVAIREAWRAR
jgi:UTP--glucose-1-phosphate uridylyltransferase